MSCTDAWLKAGYNVSRVVAAANAFESLRNPVISARIEALRKPIVKKALMSKDKQRELLQAIADDPKSGPLIKIRAIEVDAKLAGYFAPDHMVVDDGPNKLASIKERANRVASLLDISARLRPTAQAAAVKDGGHANGDDTGATSGLCR